MTTTTRIETEPRWIVAQDDQVKAITATEDDAFMQLQRLQGQSADWAQRYEGWTIRQAERWDADDARRSHRMALQVLNRHDHNPSDRDPLTRENCGACVLAGYRPRGAEWSRSDGPNYAGWARIYVEACQPIPAHWVDAFQRERDGVPFSDGSVNLAYMAALERDIATFGIRISHP